MPIPPILLAKLKRSALIITLFLNILFLSNCATNSVYLSTELSFNEEIQDTTPSFSYKILDRMVRSQDGKSIWGQDEQSMKNYFDQLDQSDRLIIPSRFIRKFDVMEFEINNRPCYLIESKETKRSDKIVLFLHGGGFVFDMDFYHWNSVEKIVNQLSIPVYVGLYPIYPETNPDNIMDFVLELYSKIINEKPDTEIILLGDSSGANLSLSLCHYIIENDIDVRLPDKLILVSPAMVLGIDQVTLQKMKEIEPLDNVFPMEILTNLPTFLNISMDSENYFYTPLLGNFKRFPPIYVFSGTYEIFFPLIPLFVERVRKDGSQIEFYIGNKLMHVWPFMPFAIESKYAFSLILDIIEK